MRYRKKPIEIEAFQYNGELIVFNAPRWLVTAQRKGTLYFEDCSTEKCYLKTPVGDVHVNIGDYIICGVNGYLYPCNPNVFEETYERAD